MKKLILIIISIVGGLVILWCIFPLTGGLLISGIFNPPISKNKMEVHLNKDYELIMTVTNYLADSNYKNIHVYETMESGEMSIAGEHEKIEDTKVVAAIDALKSYGYHSITKRDNTISFQKWGALDNSRGIAYSIDGSEPELQFLTKLEPLSAANWYYYEEDYNEWRERNK